MDWVLRSRSQGHTPLPRLVLPGTRRGCRLAALWRTGRTVQCRWPLWSAWCSAHPGEAFCTPGGPGEHTVAPGLETYQREDLRHYKALSNFRCQRGTYDGARMEKCKENRNTHQTVHKKSHKNHRPTIAAYLKGMDGCFKQVRAGDRQRDFALHQVIDLNETLSWSRGLHHRFLAEQTEGGRERTEGSKCVCVLCECASSHVVS